MTMKLVLASASPRRQELLADLGLSFAVRPADIDESVHSGEAGADYVRRLAREKATAVAGAGELVANLLTKTMPAPSCANSPILCTTCTLAFVRC